MSNDLTVRRGRAFLRVCGERDEAQKENAALRDASTKQQRSIVALERENAALAAEVREVAKQREGHRRKEQELREQVARLRGGLRCMMSAQARKT